MKYIAHRGLAKHYTENTAAAFQAALDAGAEYIECDVWLSRDGVPVVIHDETVNRTTSNHGLVSMFTEVELAAMGVPTLSTVCGIAHTRGTVVIELKGQDTARPVADVLEACCSSEGLHKNRIVVSSFKKNVLLEFHRVMPEVACAVLVWGTPSEDEIDLYASWGMHAVHCDSADGDITESLVRHVHDRGMELWIYTVNDAAIRDAFDVLGVDGIFTDVIDVMQIHG